MLFPSRAIFFTFCRVLFPFPTLPHLALYLLPKVNQFPDLPLLVLWLLPSASFLCVWAGQEEKGIAIAIVQEFNRFCRRFFLKIIVLDRVYCKVCVRYSLFYGRNCSFSVKGGLKLISLGQGLHSTRKAWENFTMTVRLCLG